MHMQKHSCVYWNLHLYKFPFSSSVRQFVNINQSTKDCMCIQNVKKIRHVKCNDGWQAAYETNCLRRKKKSWQGKGKRYCSCHKWMMCYEHGISMRTKLLHVLHHPLENPAFFGSAVLMMQAVKKKRQKTKRQHYNEWKSALNPLTQQIETLWRNKCSVCNSWTAAKGA